MSSRSMAVSGSLGRKLGDDPASDGAPSSDGVVAESPGVDGSIAPPARPSREVPRLAAPALAPR